MQGRSHQYGWSGFNQTTFGDNNHISPNILEFDGVPGRPVDSHTATVDRVEIDDCKQFEIVTSQSLKHEGATRAHSDVSKMTAKNFFHTLHGIGTTRLYAAAFGSVTPLLQPDHFKSQGYGPVMFVSQSICMYCVSIARGVQITLLFFSAPLFVPILPQQQVNSSQQRTMPCVVMIRGGWGSQNLMYPCRCYFKQNCLETPP